MNNLKVLTAAAGMVALCAFPGLAQTTPPIGVTITDPGGSEVSTRVTVGLNKSSVIELDTPAADIVITNPGIADAIVQTSRRIIVRGVAFGQTNAIIFDASGNELANLDLNVEMNTSELTNLVEKHVPGARVSVESANGKLVLSGHVGNASQLDQVLELAALYSPTGKQDILNLMEVRAKDQVLLRVKVVEMQRGVTKQLGIDLSSFTSNVFNDLGGTLGTALGLNATGGRQGGLVGDLTKVISRAPYIFVDADGNQFVSDDFVSQIGGVPVTYLSGGDPTETLSASFSALERIGLSRTLAEPNIVAISGETGEFLAGGEFPIPVAGTNDSISVEFKKFGVSLAFTPVVLSEGRISLNVATEVSEISAQGAVNFSGVTIPAVATRRVTSAVEIPSGGSMMLAGLIQSTSISGMDRVPGIGEVPVLGALFRSRDFVNNETELVIIVTPYLVDPSNPDKLRSPDAGYSLSSDLSAFLFGKLNDIYGKDGSVITPTDYQASVGFIEE